MTFADLTAGDSVFLDANTLIYHFRRTQSWDCLAINCCNGSRTRNWRG